jgi:hypothetical protein
MSRYHQLLGRRVEVQYRAGDIVLPATGTLAADSGKSIFLEEKLVQRGQVKSFRWEIPYICIMSLDENFAPPPAMPREQSPEQSPERHAAKSGYAPLRSRAHEA